MTHVLWPRLQHHRWRLQEGRGGEEGRRAQHILGGVGTPVRALPEVSQWLELVSQWTGAGGVQASAAAGSDTYPQFTPKPQPLSVQVHTRRGVKPGRPGKKHSRSSFHASRAVTASINPVS